MTKRPSNRELGKEFRRLLTEGFHIGTDGTPAQFSEALAITKPWRNELWKAFAEIEARLDPLGAIDRERQTKE